MRVIGTFIDKNSLDPVGYKVKLEKEEENTFRGHTQYVGGHLALQAGTVYGYVKTVPTATTLRVTPLGLRGKDTANNLSDKPLFDSNGKALRQGMKILAKYVKDGKVIGYDVYVFATEWKYKMTDTEVAKRALYIHPDNFDVALTGGVDGKPFGFQIRNKRGMQDLDRLPIKKYKGEPNQMSETPNGTGYDNSKPAVKNTTNTFELTKSVKIVDGTRLIISGNDPENEKAIASVVGKVQEIELKQGSVVPDGMFEYSNILKRVRCTGNGGCIKIGKRAFYGCENLRSVTLSNIGCIDEEAFANCTQLHNVMIRGVSSMYDRVFQGCARLEEVDIKDYKQNEIPHYCFSQCASLHHFVLRTAKNTNIHTINLGAFKWCKALKSVTLTAAPCINIDGDAFNFCDELVELALTNAKELYVESTAPFKGTDKLRQGVGVCREINCTGGRMVPIPISELNFICGEEAPSNFGINEENYDKYVTKYGFEEAKSSMYKQKITFRPKRSRDADRDAD